MLLIFILKWVTARILSCGITSYWLRRSESLKFLSKRKSLRKPGSLSLWPELCRSLIMPYFHIESDAFSRLKKIVVSGFFFHKSFLHEGLLNQIVFCSSFLTELRMKIGDKWFRKSNSQRSVADHTLDGFV